jgi:hypothetical protein
VRGRKFTSLGGALGHPTAANDESQKRRSRQNVEMIRVKFTADGVKMIRVKVTAEGNRRERKEEELRKKVMRGNETLTDREREQRENEGGGRSDERERRGKKKN